MAVSAHARNDVGPKWLSRDPAPLHPVKRRRTIPLSAEDSLVEFKRERSNVRPYVRSSTQKLKWTVELHQCFMRAVNKLGGKDSKFCLTHLFFRVLLSLIKSIDVSVRSRIPGAKKFLLSPPTFTNSFFFSFPAEATPKRILQLMNKDDITIAHIKSHLQV